MPTVQDGHLPGPGCFHPLYQDYSDCVPVPLCFHGAPILQPVLPPHHGKIKHGSIQIAAIQPRCHPLTYGRQEVCGFGPVYCERPPVLRGACGSSGCPFFTVLGTVTPREEVPAGCNLLSSSSLQSQTVCHRKEEGKSAWDGLCHAWRLSWLLLFPVPPAFSCNPTISSHVLP